jgi:tetratricopeptide (TPR) repeat protein
MSINTQSRNHIIAGVLAIIVIIALASYTYTRRSASKSTEQSATSSAITTTTDGVTVSGGTVTVTSQSSSPVAPDYKKQLTFKADLSDDVRSALQRQFDMTVAVLDNDKLSFRSWVNLATMRQTTGDYKGAEVVLTYVSKIYPKSTVPFDNLGWLYLDFLKDYPKAESAFKQAIKNDAHDINAYQQLVSLYTIYGYKDVAAARDLLKQGLAANPGSQALLDIQTQLGTQ